MEGAAFYIGLIMIGLCGLPLAILAILINPTIADMARAEYARTGESREAMFFGARAIPLKATIALAGVTFTYLLPLRQGRIQPPWRSAEHPGGLAGQPGRLYRLFPLPGKAGAKMAGVKSVYQQGGKRLSKFREM